MDVQDCIKFIETGKLFSRKDHILLAVSGGVDSAVMAHLFHVAGYTFAVAHCNFGLRGLESEADEAFVKALAQQMKAPFFYQKFDTAGFSTQHGISIQMAARELRYDWFEKVRKDEGYDFIATAHHLDDQAETFLINLLRGTGIAGLHGIPVRNNHVVRPMMFTGRTEIEEYARQHEVKYRVDRSNSETKYLRNKIRHELMPALCRINPDFPSGIHDTIGRLRDFEILGNTLFDHWKRSVLKTRGDEQIIDISSLQSQDPTGLYAWMLLSPYGFNETQVSNLVGCLSRDDHKVFLSATHRLVKERKALVISALKTEIVERPVDIAPFKRTRRLKEPVSLEFQRLSKPDRYVIPAGEQIASLDAGKLVFPLLLRKWRSGDSFYPLGLKKRKKLSDFFIDRKLTQRQKKEVWLLCSEKKIVWVVGYRIDHRFRITSSTKEIIRITLQQE